MSSSEKFHETIRIMLIIPLAIAQLVGQFADAMTTDIALRSGRFLELGEMNPIVEPWINDSMFELYIIKIIIGIVIAVSCYVMYKSRRWSNVTTALGILVIANAWNWSIVHNNMSNMGVW
jgi:hypothetical protein